MLPLFPVAASSVMELCHCAVTATLIKNLAVVLDAIIKDRNIASLEMEIKLEAFK